MPLVDRAKNMIMSPAREWPVIAGETPTVGNLYTGYILILSAISPIVIVLSAGLFGAGLGTAIAGYLLGLVMVYVLAWVVDFLAPSFGGEKNFIRALQLVAYSATAAWVSGIFHLIPIIGGILALAASLCSLYAFYLGAPVLRKCAVEKAVVFTIVYVVCAIVAGALIGMVLFGMAGVGMTGVGITGVGMTGVGMAGGATATVGAAS